MLNSDGRRARMTRTLLSSVLLVLCSGTTVHAQVPGSRPSSIAAAHSSCTGRCSPSLVSLTNGKVLSTWSAEDGATWTQLFDLAAGETSSEATSLGRLGAGERPLADQPLVVPLPAGDIAMLGVTADARVTFTRGSEVALRHVPPSISIAASQEAIAAIAAGADDDGVVLALLRAPKGVEPSARAPSKLVLELQWLGARGEPKTSLPIRRPTAADASNLHVSRCAERYYVVSSSGRELLVQSIDGAGHGGPERRLKAPRLAGPGVLECIAQKAVWVAGVQPSPTSSQLASELMLLDLTQLDTTKPEWRWIGLPAPPRTPLINGERLAAHARAGGIDVLIARKATSQLIHLDLASGQTEPVLDVGLAERECLLAPSAKRAVCAAARPNDPTSSCSNMPSRVELSFYGESGAVAAASRQTYFQTGAIPDPDAPAAAQKARRATRVSCGEPGWSDLRKALEMFCSAEPRTGNAARYKSYCAADAEGSLLYQVQRCTNLPKGCPPSRRGSVPSVDRRQYERGERVELSYLGCAVWFAKKAGEFQVVDHECAGD